MIELNLHTFNPEYRPLLINRLIHQFQVIASTKEYTTSKVTLGRMVVNKHAHVTMHNKDFTVADRGTFDIIQPLTRL